MIKIRTEKIVHKGVQSRKVLELEALTTDELPTEYLNNGPYFSLRNKGRECEFFDTQNLKIGGDLLKNSLYEEGNFQQRLEGIRLCGERLTEINKRVKVLKEIWNGEETFLI